MCVCVCIYICMYVCMYVCTRKCVSVTFCVIVNKSPVRITIFVVEWYTSVFVFFHLDLDFQGQTFSILVFLRIYRKSATD